SASAPGARARGGVHPRRAVVRPGASQGGPDARAATIPPPELRCALLAPATLGDGTRMKLRLGAAVCAAVLLVAVMGAPALPVMIGATAAYAWLLWRALATR